MERNPYGHVDIRVRDVEEALRFYGELLPALGFTRSFQHDEWNVFAVEGAVPGAPFYGFTENPDHVANDNRIAFWAASPEEVDRIGALLREAGASISSGPRECPEYGGYYYAVFFEDPSGNKLEVLYRRP